LRAAGIHRVAADVHDIDHMGILDFVVNCDCGGVGLGKRLRPCYLNRDGFFVEFKVDAKLPANKVLLKSLEHSLIVQWRQSDEKLHRDRQDIDFRAVLWVFQKFLADCEQGEDKEALILGLVVFLRHAFAGQGVFFALIDKDITSHRGQMPALNVAGCERAGKGFNTVVAVVYRYYYLHSGKSSIRFLCCCLGYCALIASLWRIGSIGRNDGAIKTLCVRRFVIWRNKYANIAPASKAARHPKGRQAV
jgi:hypothetical protein